MKHSRALWCCGLGLTAAVANALMTSPAQGHPPRPIEVIGHKTQVPPEEAGRSVSYADLNLASATDERVLAGRVDVAVKEVCDVVVGTAGTVGPLSPVNKFNRQDCAFDAWKDARPQIASAVQRAHEIALTGTSLIPAAAIIIDVGH